MQENPLFICTLHTFPINMKPTVMLQIYKAVVGGGEKTNGKSDTTECATGEWVN